MNTFNLFQLPVKYKKYFIFFKAAVRNFFVKNWSEINIWAST